MVRHAVRVLVVVGLIGLGWAAGRAQAPTSAQSPPAVSSDFELLVTSTGGETEVRCVSGCRLTWAPTVQPQRGPVEMLAPDVRVRGSVSPKGCISPSWMAQNCRILGWQR
jgi:hypothetical protein